MHVNGEVIQPPPFLNGKLFHVKAEHYVVLTLPPMKQNDKVQFVLVNMSDEGIKVDIETKVGKFHARGHILRHKYDNAVVYFDGKSGYGYGDLGDPMNIRTSPRRNIFLKEQTKGKFYIFIQPKPQK